MISEKDKQAVLRGEFGVARNGLKCKYVGTTNDPEYPLQFVYYVDNTDLIKGAAAITADFISTNCGITGHDVVGLWADKPEPFDLERALAGSSVMLRNGSKANILKQIKDTLIGYFDECSPFSWDINGDASLAAESNHDIIGMWKEPEPELNTVTFTLPRALKEPKDEMWFIYGAEVRKSIYNASSLTRKGFEQVTYFASKEDAEAWLNVLKNSRE